MNEVDNKEAQVITVASTRFGELKVPQESVIHFPAGIIGFPQHKQFVMLEHKPPFSWLHSVDDPNLAFVVVDGLLFGEQYHLDPPVGDREIDLLEDDEYAILVIVTVRPNPKDTTANIKAPIFVNLRNRKALQVIYDNPSLTTRFAIWPDKEEESAG